MDADGDVLTPLATINGVTDEVGTVEGVIELDDTVDITWEGLVTDISGCCCSCVDVEVCVGVAAAAAAAAAACNEESTSSGVTEVGVTVGETVGVISGVKFDIGIGHDDVGFTVDATTACC